MEHPVPEGHLKAIGHIVVSFALLEMNLQLLVGSLLGEQRIGQIVTAELSTRALPDLIVSLYLERYGEDDDVASIRQIMKKVRVVEEKRNQIVHSVWGAGDTAEQLTRIKMTAKQKRGFHVAAESYTAESLNEIANEISQTSKEILRLLTGR